MKKLLQEFKAFAVRGNVVDMAVGVVIGSAFGKIVTSLVNDLIMPLIGALLGNVSFSELAITLVPATETTDAVLFKYGSFIQVIIDFLIVAVSIFAMVKVINSMKRKKKEEEKPAEPPKPSNEVVLLTEIRDLLKNR